MTEPEAKIFELGQRTPKRVELKDVFKRRDLPFTEAALLLSTLGLRSPYPPRQVNSLYFDSSNYRSLERSLSGSSIRKKIRLRWYGQIKEARHPTLEFKCKQGHLSWKVLQKTKLCIDHNAMDWISAFSDDKSPSPGLGDILPVNHHRPITLVSYKRRYYESYDRRIRVTIDEDLAFRDQTLCTGLNFNRIRLHPEKLVLEIKFAEENIDAFRELARTLPFVPRRFSKYCEALLGHMPYWR